MYLQELPCSWFDHPFVRRRFLIKDWETVATIRRLPVDYVYIDILRGDDPDSVPPLEEGGLVTGTVDTRKSAEQVMAIWQDAVVTVEAMMSEVRLGGRPKLPEVESAVESMMEVVATQPQALFGLMGLRSKDRYTFEHCVSVGFLALSYAHALGRSQQEVFEIGVGAILHDIGKARTPEEILNKPGKLRPEEMEVMKGHAAETRAIVSELSLSETAFAAAAHHHERLDGSGYPSALAGEQLGIPARIVAICDVYDAMTADRCYRRGIAPAQALRALLERAGSDYDETLVHRFIRFIGIYPPGTLVRLSGERLAIVMGQGEHLLYPKVRVFYDALKKCEIVPQDLHLGPDTPEQVVAPENPATWGFTSHELLLRALD